MTQKPDLNEFGEAITLDKSLVKKTEETKKFLFKMSESNVAWEAINQMTRSKDITFTELVSVGFEALESAWKNWLEVDLLKQVTNIMNGKAALASFNTFALNHIRTKMAEAVSQSFNTGVSMPFTAERKARKMARTLIWFIQTYGYRPTDEQLACITDLSIEQVNSFRHIANCIDNDLTLKEAIEIKEITELDAKYNGSENPFTDACLKSVLKQIKAKLTKEEYFVFAHTTGIESKMFKKDMAEILDVKSGEIDKIAESATSKLKSDVNLLEDLRYTLRERNNLN